MYKLERAKEVIKENYSSYDYGIFNSRNLVGDYMVNIYEDEDGLSIDACPNWAYFEVFGLTNQEFEELKKYYYSLRDEEEDEEEDE